MIEPTAPRKPRMCKAQRRLLERLLVQLERAKDIINDPKTSDERLNKIATILENYRYRRGRFARHFHKPSKRRPATPLR